MNSKQITRCPGGCMANVSQKSKIVRYFQSTKEGKNTGIKLKPKTKALAPINKFANCLYYTKNEGVIKNARNK